MPVAIRIFFVRITFCVAKEEVPNSREKSFSS
jgi:hypothetical protein